MVYMGLESGCDEVLTLMRKGHQARSQSWRWAEKVRRNGIALSVTAIAGLRRPGAAGTPRVVETAKAFNAMDPEYIGMLTLMVEPGTPLHDWLHEGKFHLLDQAQVLRETRILMENLDSPAVCSA